MGTIIDETIFQVDNKNNKKEILKNFKQFLKTNRSK